MAFLLTVLVAGCFGQWDNDSAGISPIAPVAASIPTVITTTPASGSANIYINRKPSATL